MRNLLLFLSVIFSVSMYSQEKKEYIGKQYPDFKATTLTGQTITQKQLKGKITLINFWHHQCSPCLAEMDALAAIYDEFKDIPSFQFLSFTYDTPSVIKNVMKKYKMPYPISSLSEEECLRIKVCESFPVTIVTDRTGKILYSRVGASKDKETNSKILEPVKQLIKESLGKQQFDPLVDYCF